MNDTDDTAAIPDEPLPWETRTGTIGRVNLRIDIDSKVEPVTYRYVDSDDISFLQINDRSGFTIEVGLGYEPEHEAALATALIDALTVIRDEANAAIAARPAEPEVVPA